MTKRILNLFLDKTGSGTLKVSKKIPKQTLKLVAIGYRFSVSGDATSCKNMFLSLDFLVDGCGAYNTDNTYLSNINPQDLENSIMIPINASVNFVAMNQMIDMSDDIDGEIVYKLTSAGSFTVANFYGLTLSFEYED